jgi:hypothetical protein
VSAKSSKSTDLSSSPYEIPTTNDLAVRDSQGRIHFFPHEGQQRAWNSEARFILVLAGAQSGKALALSTLIPTPYGNFSMSEIKAGDLVLDEHGRPTEVTYASEVFLGHDCFNLEFSTGETITSDADHIWALSGVNLTARQIWECTNGADAFIEPHRLVNRDSGKPIRLISIEKTETVPTKCIAVDNPSHLFLCGETRIPTHNTSFGPHWLYREIRMKGPGDYLVVTPTFQLLQKKALPEFQKLFQRWLKLGKYIQNPSRQFEFSWEGERRTHGDKADRDKPTVVHFGYADDPESLESMTSKAAWLDEAGQKRFRHNSWEAIQRRLAIHEGRALLTTTPYDLGWLKTEVHDRWVAGDTDYDVINFESVVNPNFSREEFERQRRTLPSWKFDLFYRGIFTKPAGLIYDSFLREHHCVKRFEIPRTWQRWVGIDFGGVNTAAVFYAQDPGSKLWYAYREYHAGKKRIKEHVEAIKHGEPFTPIAVGGNRAEGQWRDEFGQHGMFVHECPIIDVEVGIQRVWSAHRLGVLRVFDDLKGYLDQKASYSRETDDKGNQTDEIANKGDYHFMDAERYFAGKVFNSSYSLAPRRPVGGGSVRVIENYRVL